MDRFRLDIYRDDDEPSVWVTFLAPDSDEAIDHADDLMARRSWSEQGLLYDLTDSDNRPGVTGRYVAHISG